MTSSATGSAMTYTTLSAFLIHARVSMVNWPTVRMPVPTATRCSLFMTLRLLASRHSLRRETDFPPIRFSNQGHVNPILISGKEHLSINGRKSGLLGRNLRIIDKIAQVLNVHG